MEAGTNGLDLGASQGGGWREEVRDGRRINESAVDKDKASEKYNVTGRIWKS